MEPIAFVYRDPEQTMQVYINEFDDAKLDWLEKAGKLFFAEYENGKFKQVSRGEVVNPNKSYTGEFHFMQKEEQEP